LLNYYNPFALECPDSVQFVHELNDHLQADAAQFRLPVVDIYTKFGGDTGTAGHLCALTWMCSAQFHDIHPTDAGYQAIADAVEATLGLPGTNPVAPVAPVAPAAALWRWATRLVAA
ncbi:MAG: hypothetical protein ACRDID_17930, partial [Ktedonobacterales bacterium]